MENITVGDNNFFEKYERLNTKEEKLAFIAESRRQIAENYAELYVWEKAKNKEIQENYFNLSKKLIDMDLIIKGARQDLKKMEKV
jgi:hypothetical protein